MQIYNNFGEETEEERQFFTKFVAACDRLYLYTWKWQQMTGLVNWGFMSLVLGGFGPFLDGLVFWVCWSTLLYQALVHYTLRPILRWYDAQEKSSLQVEETDLGQTEAGVKIHSEVSGPSKIFLPKLVLASILLGLLQRRSLTTSDQCTRGSNCYLRLSESLWFLVVMFFLEVGPAILIDDLLRGNRKIWAYNLRRAIFEGRSIYSFFAPGNDSSKLEPQHNGDILQYLFSKFKQEVTALQEEIAKINFREKWFTSIGELSFIPSAFSVVLILTVGLLVGGSFGTYMTYEAYWLCSCSVITEVLIESIFGIEAEDKEGFLKLRSTPRVIVSWILRFLTQGTLFGLMLDVLLTRHYFSLDLNGCDRTCQDRGRELLYVACAAMGLQSLSFLFSPISYIITGLAYACAVFGSNVLQWGIAMPCFILVVLTVFCLYYFLAIIGALLDRAIGKTMFGSWLGLRPKI